MTKEEEQRAREAATTGLIRKAMKRLDAITGEAEQIKQLLKQVETKEVREKRPQGQGEGPVSFAVES